VKGRREDDETADTRGHTASGSERAREGAADGWGRFASEREGERRGEGARACGEVGLRVWAGKRPSRGGRRVFLFSFLFSISFIHFFISFSFEQLIDNLRC
jgi:hypothetical protein